MESTNSIAQTKCIGFNLERMSDSIYKSIHGYFIIKNDSWIFTPLDKEFDVDTLFSIIDTLRNLNESHARRY
jgi:hypothetical protein